MDITNILRFAITLCTAVVTIFVIPWLHSKTSEQERLDLVQWAKIAVQAAEQLCHGKKGQGALKKATVKEFLEAKGFTVSEPEIDQAIEAAVWEMNQALQRTSIDKTAEESLLRTIKADNILNDPLLMERLEWLSGKATTCDHTESSLHSTGGIYIHEEVSTAEGGRSGSESHVS